MSPRAAWRLETLGFTWVYDYVDGKVDWLGHGSPTEGDGPHYAVAGEVVSTDVATCSLHESLSEVRERVQDSDYDFCVVVNGARVVLGRVRKKRLARAGGVASEVMEAGPPPFARASRWLLWSSGYGCDASFKPTRPLWQERQARCHA